MSPCCPDILIQVGVLPPFFYYCSPCWHALFTPGSFSFPSVSYWIEKYLTPYTTLLLYPPSSDDKRTNGNDEHDFFFRGSTIYPPASRVTFSFSPSLPPSIRYLESYHTRAFACTYFFLFSFFFYLKRRIYDKQRTKNDISSSTASFCVLVCATLYPTCLLDYMYIFRRFFDSHSLYLGFDTCIYPLAARVGNSVQVSLSLGPKIGCNAFVPLGHVRIQA